MKIDLRFYEWGNAALWVISASVKNMEELEYGGRFVHDSCWRNKRSWRHLIVTSSS